MRAGGYFVDAPQELTHDVRVAQAFLELAQIQSEIDTFQDMPGLELMYALSAAKTALGHLGVEGYVDYLVPNPHI